MLMFCWWHHKAEINRSHGYYLNKYGNKHKSTGVPNVENYPPMTHQVLHLAIWSAILHVSDVGEPRGSVLHQFVHNGGHRLKVHIPGFHIMLAGHQPRLEQVFIEAVPQSPQGDVLCTVRNTMSNS